VKRRRIDRALGFFETGIQQARQRQYGPHGHASGKIAIDLLADQEVRIGGRSGRSRCIQARKSRRHPPGIQRAQCGGPVPVGIQFHARSPRIPRGGKKNEVTSDSCAEVRHKSLFVSFCSFGRPLIECQGRRVVDRSAGAFDRGRDRRRLQHLHGAFHTRLDRS